MAKPAAALRNVIVIADPHTAGRALLERMGSSGYAAFALGEDSGELLQQVQAHTGNGGKPVAVLLETSSAEGALLDSLRALQQELNTPVCVLVTRQDRALQTALELAEGEYSYKAFRKRLNNDNRLWAKVRGVVPQGPNTPTIEVGNEALRNNWRLEVRRLSTFLSSTIAPGAEETGREQESALVLGVAEQFRAELTTGGKPASAVQPALGRNPRHGYGETTGASAQLKTGDKLRPRVTTAEQASAMQQAKQAASQKKSARRTKGGGGGGGGRRQDDPAQGPVMGERTRAAKRLPEVVAKSVGREEGMNKAKQLARRPVVEKAARQTATQTVAPEPVVHRGPTKTPKAQQPPAPTRTPGAPGTKHYWDGRKAMKYYGEAVALARQYAPNAESVLDVGGRDCLYTLDIPARLRVTVDPDLGPNHPDIQWIKADFMAWQPDRIYDVAMCLQVLEHVKDPSAFLKAILAVSRVAVVSVPFNWAPTHDHTHHRLKTDVFEKWAGRKPDHIAKVKEEGRKPGYDKRTVAVFVQKPVATPAPQVFTGAKPVSPRTAQAQTAPSAVAAPLPQAAHPAPVEEPATPLPPPQVPQAAPPPPGALPPPATEPAAGTVRVQRPDSDRGF